MKIADNVLRDSLKNVYFISGTGYGGKTTIANSIAEEFCIPVYHVDDHYGEYRVIANLEEQPTFCKKFKSWQEYFNRKPEIYSKWLNESMRECIEFAIIDLLKLSSKGKVIAEGVFPLEIMQKITYANQCVFLIAEYDLLRRGFFNRADKADMVECIKAQRNPEQIFDNVINAITFDYFNVLETVKASGMNYIIRTESTEHEKLKRKVISNLGLLR